MLRLLSFEYKEMFRVTSLYIVKFRVRVSHSGYRVFHSEAGSICFDVLGLSRLRFEHAAF